MTDVVDPAESLSGVDSDADSDAASNQRPPEELGPVRQRRRRLHHALVQLEDAVAQPAPTSPTWAKVVHAALDELHAAFEQHVIRNDEEDGLFAQVLADAPRLNAAVERLRHEHDRLLAETAALRDRTQTDALDSGQATVVRERVLELIREFSRHRQRGADLVYEAYEVDIAAGD